MRIAKYISHSGYCSRRKAEELIFEKKVYINNNLCEKPSTNVNLNDKVHVEKKLLKMPNKIRLWKLYKPVKTICTNKDPKKRKTIFDILPKNFPNVISIGRLDYMSEGLILLTNNGDFARKLELPSSEIIRNYNVLIKGIVNNKIISKINQGICIKGIHYNKVKVKVLKKQKDSKWLNFKLKEGKNREIRNICKHFKFEIIKLIRVKYGPINLSTQKPGEIKEIKYFFDL